MVEFSNADGTKAPKHTQHEAAAGVRISPGPFIGIVYNNVDTMRSGRIQVYIPDLGGDPTKESSWRTVSYASPFFGVTPPPKDQTTGTYTTRPAGQSFETNPHSYGMWMVPPDLGTRVLVMFVNGDPFQGYWFACIPDWPNMHMVPAVAAQPGDKVPVVDYNDTEKNSAATIDQFYQRQNTPHTKVAQQFERQGLTGDDQRGAITSSAFRESPSYVYGISTPGRKLIDKYIDGTGADPDAANTAGTGTTSGGARDSSIADASGTTGGNAANSSKNGRRGGHSFVMDDGDENGANQLIRLRSSQGHQLTMHDTGGFIYIITSSGNAWLDMDSEGNVNLYAKGQFNLKADGAIQIESGQSVKIQAQSTVDVLADGTVNLTGKGGINLSSAGMTKVEGKKGLHLKGENTYLTGDKCVQINGGQHLDLSASCVGLNSKQATKAQGAQTAQPVRGMPTKEPWAGHKRKNSGLGVSLNTFSSGGMTGSYGTGGTSTIAPNPSASGSPAGDGGGISGGAIISGSAARTPFTGSQAAYYNKMYDSIYKSAVEKGVPNPEVIAQLGAAQTAVETAYGTRMVGNNAFGIKGVGPAGSVTASTTEVLNGQTVRINDGFRRYNNLDESAADYVDFLKKNPRYKEVLQATNVTDAANKIRAAGYATDPAYAAKVTAVHNRGLLTRQNTAPNDDSPANASRAAGINAERSVSAENQDTVTQVGFVPPNQEQKYRDEVKATAGGGDYGPPVVSADKTELQQKVTGYSAAIDRFSERRDTAETNIRINTEKLGNLERDYQAGFIDQQTYEIERTNLQNVIQSNVNTFNFSERFINERTEQIAEINRSTGFSNLNDEYAASRLVTEDNTFGDVNLADNTATAVEIPITDALGNYTGEVSTTYDRDIDWNAWSREQQDLQGNNFELVTPQSFTDQTNRDLANARLNDFENTDFTGNSVDPWTTTPNIAKDQAVNNALDDYGNPLNSSPDTGASTNYDSSVTGPQSTVNSTDGSPAGDGAGTAGGAITGEKLKPGEGGVGPAGNPSASTPQSPAKPAC